TAMRSGHRDRHTDLTDLESAVAMRDGDLTRAPLLARFRHDLPKGGFCHRRIRLIVEMADLATIVVVANGADKEDRGPVCVGNERPEHRTWVDRVDGDHAAIGHGSAPAHGWDERDLITVGESSGER